MYTLYDRDYMRDLGEMKMERYIAFDLHISLNSGY